MYDLTVINEHYLFITSSDTLLTVLARGSRPSVRPLESALECSRDPRPWSLVLAWKQLKYVLSNSTLLSGRFTTGELFIAFAWSSSTPQIAASYRRPPQTGPSLDDENRSRRHRSLSILSVTVRVSRVRWLPTDTPASHIPIASYSTCCHPL